jgi:hypothetical protein
VSPNTPEDEGSQEFDLSDEEVESVAGGQGVDTEFPM